MVELLWKEVHVLKVVSSNPSTGYLMVNFFTFICRKIVLMFERAKL